MAEERNLATARRRCPERDRIKRLAAVAKTLHSPIISEHIAFARAGQLRADHFMPVPHTRAQLAVMVDHVRRVADALPVPLALENVAAPFAWPGAELVEADFIAELIARTGAYLLLDVANLVANLANHGGDLAAYLDHLPLDRIAYMHVAGGARVDVMWRDTHAHAIPATTALALDTVLARTGPRPILLERDHAFDSRAELDRDLDLIAQRLATCTRTSRAPREIALARLPAIDRTTLGAIHHDLLASLLATDNAPPRGVPAYQWNEARAILARKRARHRAR